MDQNRPRYRHFEESKIIKNNEKNASKMSHWLTMTWLEHAQDMLRTCSGHAQDMAWLIGSLKIQNRTKACYSTTNKLDGNPTDHWETVIAMESPILYMYQSAKFVLFWYKFYWQLDETWMCQSYQINTQWTPKSSKSENVRANVHDK